MGAQLLRCINHMNDGLIHVILWIENGARRRPAPSAASAMADEYA